jgi:hypothetical protein
MSYIKPGPNYKMTKQTKRILALIVDPHKQGIQKRLMIQAELASLIVPRREKKANINIQNIDLIN